MVYCTGDEHESETENLVRLTSCRSHGSVFLRVQTSSGIILAVHLVTIEVY